MSKRARTIILISIALLVHPVRAQSPVTSGTASQMQYSESREAKRIYQLASSLVFPIHISATLDAPKVSYGTGFVIRKTGLIATNFHVVSQAVLEPTRYKPFLVIDGKKVQAEIVAFDLIADLALLRVDQNFPGELVLRDELPSVGEKLFSVGLPEDLSMLVTEGNSGGTSIDLLSENIVLSAPLNPGMSGGPTFDDRGQVRGVNVAILKNSQNLAFVVPTRNLHALVEQLDQNGPMGPLTTRSAFQKFETQLTDSMHAAVVRLTKGSTNRRRVANFLAPLTPAGVKCWDVPIEDKANQTLMRFRIDLKTFQTCTNSRGIPLPAKMRLGSWREGYAIFSNGLDLSQKRGMDHVFNSLPESVFSDYFGGAAEDEAGSFSAPKCTTQTLQNSFGVRWKANICARGYRAFPTLFDFAIKAMTLSENGPNALSYYRISGITADDARSVLQYALESPSWEKK